MMKFEVRRDLKGYDEEAEKFDGQVEEVKQVDEFDLHEVVELLDAQTRALLTRRITSVSAVLLVASAVWGWWVNSYLVTIAVWTGALPFLKTILDFYFKQGSSSA